MSIFTSKQSTETSTESLHEWRQRVSSIQRERQDPAAIAVAEAKSQAKLRIKKNATKAKRLQTVQAFTKCSNAGNMASLRSASRSSSSSQQPQMISSTLNSAFGAAAQIQSREEANERVEISSKAMTSLQQAVNAEDEEEADLLIEEARAQFQNAGHAWAENGIEGANEVSELLEEGIDMFGGDNDSDDDNYNDNDNHQKSEINDLLSDLKLEPTNDEDCSRRFQLYEEHTETVSTIRNSLLSFWLNAKDDVPNCSAKDSIEASLANIDHAENLEVYLNPKYWFIYSMAKKVTLNENKIGKVLREIQIKLDLLASNSEDCPICLDSIDDVNHEHVFGCAHKIHKECWNHWSRHCSDNMKQPFCPLCRNDEFLQDILS
mmetsp:Transcript_11656/g.14059  ORF Transcript_11656/g.14059 Transcript_11656/m.14059 type:complete len:377 (+) Transcript_11656:56-1186(+)